MPSRFVEALRERLTLRNIVAGTAIFGGLYVLFDGTPEQFLSSVIGTAVVGLTDVTGDAYDLRPSVQHGGIGLSAIAGGVAMLALGADDVVVPALFLAFGAWFVLDAVQTARHEGATKDVTARDGHDVYLDYVARRVHETLGERPLTRRELHGELKGDDESIDAAIVRLQERGVVERVGSELRVESSNEDANTAPQLRNLARRIARPLTLELENARSSEREGTEEGRRTRYPSDPTGADNESERIDARN